ncbi:Gamma-tubulin ring complex protein [Ceraceosorus bombacis]|uniref:Spindle pole body component n=1 Tax=Ceraceosorus bombacis TaxID=401625 RepID=A0A0P1BD47_9BASI|nr:Gamma-tubulin ring complex protein [Ceraceosorus bombacis]
MIAEVLLHLHGVPSSLFPSPDALHPALQSLLHPGEVCQLLFLSSLASDAHTARTWAEEVLRSARSAARRRRRHVANPSDLDADGQAEEEEEEEDHVAFVDGAEQAAVARSMLARLDMWRSAVSQVQRAVLQGKAASGHASKQQQPARGNHVDVDLELQHCSSLAGVRAALEPWCRPLSNLADLAYVLNQARGGAGAGAGAGTWMADAKRTAARPWPPAQLLSLLAMRTQASVGATREHMQALLDAAESVWLRRVRGWVCHGRASGLFIRIRAADGLNAVAARHVDVDVDVDAQAQAELHRPAAAAHLAAGLEEDRQEWSWAPNACPDSLDPHIAETILGIGRALRALPASVRVPSVMRDQHLALLGPQDQVSPANRQLELKLRLDRIRDELAEWMWGNVLTPDQVMETVQMLGDYFMHRSGLFHSFFLDELSSLRRTQLTTRTAAAGMIKPSDVDVALYRAASASDLPSELLSHVRVLVPRSRNAVKEAWSPFADIPLGSAFCVAYSPPFPLDLLLTRTDARAYSEVFSYLLALRSTSSRLRDAWTSMSKAQRLRRKFTGTSEGGGNTMEEHARSELLRLGWNIAREGLWIIDSLVGHFQTDIIDVQYSRLIAQLELESINAIDHAHPLSAQPSGRSVAQPASGAALRRSRVAASATGRPVSPDNPDARPRTSSGSGRRASEAGLARSRYGSGPAAAAAAAALSRGAPSLVASRRHGGAATLAGHSSHIGPLGASIVTAPEGTSQLDFSTLRSAHTAFLAFVVDGLLLRSPRATTLIRAICDTCQKFAGLVASRWGGDVLPGLLEEGSIGDTTSARDGVSNTIDERTRAMNDVSDTLRGQLDEFFALLSTASAGPGARDAHGNNGSGSGGASGTSMAIDASIASVSMSTYARPGRTGGGKVGADGAGLKKAQGQGPNASKAKTKVTEARLDADSAARRHLDALLLRLDFSGWLSRRETERREREKKAAQRGAREREDESLEEEEEREQREQMAKLRVLDDLRKQGQRQGQGQAAATA